MSRVAGILILLSALAGRAALPPAPPAPLNDPVEGWKLAQQLRQMAPVEETVFAGEFVMERNSGPDTRVPVSVHVTLRPAGWTTVYAARWSNAAPVLVIHRATNAPGRYEFSPDTNREPARAATAVTNDFAGSDFTWQDLGLEFIHWPGQVLLTREMRKGRGCHVLESRPEGTNLYSRVVSWIDEETLGVLMAEAYDAGGRLLKQFEVRGFKKVAGRWQVREMELRNRRTKGGTRLEFQFDAK
jgi:hypothetical protein